MLTYCFVRSTTAIADYEQGNPLIDQDLNPPLAEMWESQHPIQSE